MPAAPRRYLDNAATSWPKPPAVLEAWMDAAARVGATAGRAAYREAVEAESIRGRARAACGRILGGVAPARVAFTAGCTIALNTAIGGLLRPGDHVIATAADHNAVLRPLHALERRGVIALSIVPCDGGGRVDPQAIAAAWRPATRLVCCTHASNVTGALQDVAAISGIARDRGGLFLLDASQTLGQVPFTVPGGGADIVAAPAHKWLLGTAGVGILWCRQGVEPEPFVIGGTGSASDALAMPESYPARLEAGTADVPALAALGAAIGWLEDRAIAAVGGVCLELARRCAAELATVPGVRVIAAGDGAPIVSFTVADHDPAEVAAAAEAIAGVQVRSGIHCAARVHDWLGTLPGGTVRASFGPFNTAADVEALVAAVRAIA
jgi:cysteine desulfurase / selenocysteine lyase